MNALSRPISSQAFRYYNGAFCRGSEVRKPVVYGQLSSLEMVMVFSLSGGIAVSQQKTFPKDSGVGKLR